jgi:hypothetical protein
MPCRARRFALSLALATLLGAPLVLGAVPRSTKPRAEQQIALRSPFHWLWNLLEVRWTKEGCRIDPNGGCVPAALPTPSLDAGCDPDGANCAPSLESGCRIDPNGCAGGI